MSRHEAIRLFSLVVLAASLQLSAQVNTSTIAGVITDETGSVVPDAKSARPARDRPAARSHQQRSWASSSSRSFAPGVTSSRSRAGFSDRGVGGHHAEYRRARTVNIDLKIGQVNDQMTVEATSAPLLEQETASLGTGDHAQGDQRSAAERPQLHHARRAFARRDSAACPPAPGPPASSPPPHSAPIAACSWADSAKAPPAISTMASRCATRASATAPSRRRSTRCRSSRSSATSSRPSSAIRPASSTSPAAAVRTSFTVPSSSFCATTRWTPATSFRRVVEPFKRNQYGVAGGGTSRRTRSSSSATGKASGSGSA